MSNVTALHGDRARALVQRPHRKAHIASIAPGDAQWLSMCGYWIDTEGTDADLRPELSDITSRDMCLRCFWIFALVNYEVGRAITTHPALRNARTVNW